MKAPLLLKLRLISSSGVGCQQDAAQGSRGSYAAPQQDHEHLLEAKKDAVQLALSRNLARAHIAAPMA
jgi:hypothetical protein